MSNYIIHSAKGTSWEKKNHGYIKKYRGKSGKWIYVYSQDVLIGDEYKKSAQGANLDSVYAEGKNKKGAIRSHLNQDMARMSLTSAAREEVKRKGWESNTKFFDDETKYYGEKATKAARDLRKEKESSIKHKTLSSIGKSIARGKAYLSKLFG